MFRDIGNSMHAYVRGIQTDILNAQTTFDLACQNMAALTRHPHPAEIITSLDADLTKLIHLPNNRLFSFPFIRDYSFPNSSFRLTEARRTFSGNDHTGFYDQVVGLHIFSTNEKDGYYYAVSAFQPIQNPFSLFEKAQTDPDIDPRHLIGFYDLQKFNSDEIPTKMVDSVAVAFQRAILL